jgi:hypothetical protein
VKGSQMIAGTSDLFANIDQHLRPAMVGMWLAILTLLFGFTPGIFFSLHNEAIRSRLNACAAEVRLHLLGRRSEDQRGARYVVEFNTARRFACRRSRWNVDLPHFHGPLAAGPKVDTEKPRGNLSAWPKHFPN